MINDYIIEGYLFNNEQNIIKYKFICCLIVGPNRQ